MNEKLIKLLNDEYTNSDYIKKEILNDNIYEYLSENINLYCVYMYISIINSRTYKPRCHKRNYLKEYDYGNIERGTHCCDSVCKDYTFHRINRYDCIPEISTIINSQLILKDGILL